ncbi:hypothetical protein [Levilactobacillus sp. HBUAS70063]
MIETILTSAPKQKEGPQQPAPSVIGSWPIEIGKRAAAIDNHGSTHD